MDGTPPPAVPHPSTLSPGRGRRNRWVGVIAVLVVVVVLTALFAFGLSRDPTAIRSPLLGKRAPAFQLRTLDGAQTVKLPDLRGQVVVVNFWASWCHPACCEFAVHVTHYAAAADAVRGR